MKLIITFFLFIIVSTVYSQFISDDFQLIWSDEFNHGIQPDTLKWNYEYGFVRNKELQWYQEENAYLNNGVLILEGRKERRLNPCFNPQQNNWRNNREYSEYTSASINTRAKFEFMYGILEVKARIDTAIGLWPAIWTLGIQGEWPSCGEIDLMESYPIQDEHTILANVASGTTKRYQAKWDSGKKSLRYFLDKDLLWPEKFHKWTMIWDEVSIKLYLDDELLNETKLEDTVNPDGSHPFKQPHYILLNLAIGGDNGGDPVHTKFPAKYEVDYVRVYQKKL